VSQQRALGAIDGHIADDPKRAVVGDDDLGPEAASRSAVSRRGFIDPAWSLRRMWLLFDVFG
jgi:hypothetical protein